MTTALKVSLIIILLIYIFFILKAVKKKNMKLGYLIFWCVIAIIMIIALLAPNFVDNISSLIGFGLPINMIFSIAIFIILYLIFDLNIMLAKETKKNTLLVQEISLLKKRVEELENKEKEGR